MTTAPQNRRNMGGLSMRSYAVRRADFQPNSAKEIAVECCQKATSGTNNSEWKRGLRRIYASHRAQNRTARRRNQGGGRNDGSFSKLLKASDLSGQLLYRTRRAARCRGENPIGKIFGRPQTMARPNRLCRPLSNGAPFFAPCPGPLQCIVEQLDRGSRCDEARFIIVD